MANNMRVKLIYSDNDTIDADYDFLVTSQNDYAQHICLSEKIRNSSENVKVNTNFELEKISLNALFQKALDKANAKHTRDGKVIDSDQFRKKCDVNWKRLWKLFDISPDILFEGKKREGFAKDEVMFLIHLFSGDMHMLHSTIIKNKSWSDEEKRKILECAKFMHKMCYRRNVLSEEVKQKFSILPFDDDRFRFNTSIETINAELEKTYNDTVYTESVLPILEKEEWQRRMADDVKQRLEYWKYVYKSMQNLYFNDDADLYIESHSICDKKLLNDAIEQVEKMCKG